MRLFKRVHASHVDVWESESAYVVLVDLPGVARESLRVVAESAEIHIECERRIQAPDAMSVWHTERKSGRFERWVPLGPAARPENAEARLENGVLEIRIPKGPNGNGEARVIDMIVK